MWNHTYNLNFFHKVNNLSALFFHPHLSCKPYSKVYIYSRPSAPHMWTITRSPKHVSIERDFRRSRAGSKKRNNWEWLCVNIEVFILLILVPKKNPKNQFLRNKTRKVILKPHKRSMKRLQSPKCPPVREVSSVMDWKDVKNASSSLLCSDTF